MPCVPETAAEVGTGEMLSSNSLISWLIARSGLDIDSIHLPLSTSKDGEWCTNARQIKETIAENRKELDGRGGFA